MIERSFIKQTVNILWLLSLLASALLSAFEHVIQSTDFNRPKFRDHLLGCSLKNIQLNMSQKEAHNSQYCLKA